MNGTVIRSIYDNSFKVPRISNRLKIADKIKRDAENTALSHKYGKVNYGDFLQRSKKLELFLNSTFDIESNREDLISFIFNNHLLSIIGELPNNLNEYFNTTDLEIYLENNYSDKNLIIVTILTDMDGLSASNQLDLLEEKLFEKYGDIFLDNIILSVEFE